MKLTIVIGAGGTGSYLIPMLDAHYKSSKESHAILVVDGDIVEQKNLTRQGFYESDLQLNKAEAVVSHLGNSGNVKYLVSNQYIESINHLLSIIRTASVLLKGIDEVILVSCVDNNMLRYRLELGQYLMMADGLVNKVSYYDGGNEEFHGQVLINRHTQDDFDFTDDGLVIKGGISDSLFARIDGDFNSKLTYADFELSCDEVSESAPQNIITNQFSAYNLFIAIIEDIDVPKYFNAKLCSSNDLGLIDVEVVQNELNSMASESIFESEMLNRKPISLYIKGDG